MAPDDVQVHAERSPDLAEVLALYDAVGWTAYARDAGSSPTAPPSPTCRTSWSNRACSARASASLVTAAWEPFAAVRQKVLLTDDEPGQRACYEGLGFTEASAHPGGPLRAFVKLDG